ncbi:MAG: DHA2 family efflux MFS transporter permease subunit [Gemmatimonadota bacterium]|nr:DHA2 family efflux MFS transporter permease subunit [Gemmatimonadota bacterium]MDE3215119.1 DHA2 family efflux MFS transporter permease subunit [Gemmatimonadota bacterium]
MAEKPAVNKWVVAGTVLIGTIMAVLDSSIVNVALPDMRGTLGATVDEITWVVTGYILSNVIIMPIVSMLSSRFGRKNFYLFSIASFTLASMACGLSTTLGAIVVWRIIQGIGGGVLITVSQAILREVFPPQEQGVAMGLYGLGVVLAPAFGPTLGGWITDQYSWPWVFFINVPIGIVNVLMVMRFIEDPPYLVRTRGHIDWTGLALLTVGLGALQLMLENGEKDNWWDSAFITRLAIVAAVGLALFIWRELKSDTPAVDLRLFRNGAFTSATAIGAILGLGLYAALFLLPLFLQNLLGYSAYESGLVLMPRGLAMAVLMPIAGRFYNKIGPRVLVGLGLVVSAYSFYALSHLTSEVGFWDLFWPQMWQGVGFGLIFVALSTAALATIEKPRMTSASGLYNVVRQVFGSVGVALSATQLTSGMARYHDMLSWHLGSTDLATWRWLQMVEGGMRAAGSDAYTAAQRALALLDGIVTQQAAVMSYNHVFLLITALFVICLPLVVFLKGVEHAVGMEMMGE